MAIQRKALLRVGKLTAECPIGAQCQYSFKDKDKKRVTGKCGYFNGTRENALGLFVLCNYKEPCPS